jgi:hypothetical protein
LSLLDRKEDKQSVVIKLQLDQYLLRHFSF